MFRKINLDILFWIYKVLFFIYSIESITAIDFFPDLPDSIENEIEENLNTDQWEFYAN
jgi:hypothetical protein